MSFRILLANFTAIGVLLALSACTSSLDTDDDPDGVTPDAAADTDASSPMDAAVPSDSDGAAPPAMPEAGATLTDAGGVPLDAGPDADASLVLDAGMEAGIPRIDASPPDAALPLLDASSDTSDAAYIDGGIVAPKILIDVNDVAANPDGYEWFDFRPNLLKLILSGAAETEHIAILWYTVPDGTVGLHYHAQTESVFAIDGTQSDAKGVYPTGTVYFNPPGSGHEISESSGFFILAYAAPPDFTNTALIEEYTPVRIDTTAPDFTASAAFVESGPGLRSYQVPLDAEGGMTAAFLEFVAPGEPHEFTGNYVLVLDGSCELDGTSVGPGMLAVTTDVVPLPFLVTASDSSTCLVMGISF